MRQILALVLLAVCFEASAQECPKIVDDGDFGNPPDSALRSIELAGPLTLYGRSIINFSPYAYRVTGGYNAGFVRVLIGGEEFLLQVFLPERDDDRQ